jgi:hypothetical protein
MHPHLLIEVLPKFSGIQGVQSFRLFKKNIQHTKTEVPHERRQGNCGGDS